MCIKKDRTSLIVTITGELDHHIAAKLRTKIDSELGGEIINIIFDFSELSFMDSSGVGMIMGRYKAVKLLGGSLTVAGATPQVERILKISGLMNIVDTVASVGQAIEKIKG